MGEGSIADPVQEDIGGHPADFLAGDLDGGQRRIGIGRLRGSVKTGDHDVIRDGVTAFFQGHHHMDRQVVVGTYESIRQAGQLPDPGQQPVRVAVGGTVRIENAQAFVRLQSGGGQAHFEPDQPLLEGTAVPGVPDKTEPFCAGRDEVLHQDGNAGDVFHHDIITFDQGREGLHRVVGHDGGNAEPADHVQVIPVKKLDTHDPGDLVHGEMGRKPPRRQFLRGDLVDPEGVAGPADLVGEG